MKHRTYTVKIEEFADETLDVIEHPLWEETIEALLKEFLSEELAFFRYTHSAAFKGENGTTEQANMLAIAERWYKALNSVTVMSADEDHTHEEE